MQMCPGIRLPLSSADSKKKTSYKARLTCYHNGIILIVNASKL